MRISRSDDDEQYEPILSVEDLASTVIALVQNLEEVVAFEDIVGIIRRHDKAVIQAVMTFSECAVSLRIDWRRDDQRTEQRGLVATHDRALKALYRLAVQRAPDGVAVHPMGKLEYRSDHDNGVAGCVRGVFPAFRAEGQE